MIKGLSQLLTWLINQPASWTNRWRVDPAVVYIENCPDHRNFCCFDRFLSSCRTQYRGVRVREGGTGQRSARDCVHVYTETHTAPRNVNVGGLSHSGENLLDGHFTPAPEEKVRFNDISGSTANDYEYVLRTEFRRKLMRERGQRRNRA